MKPCSVHLSISGLATWLALPLLATATRTQNALANATDGFPTLPAVSAMVGAASETLKSVNSQASVLEAKVAQAQMESEAKLARQKAVFEQKLKIQEMRNQQEVHMNDAISKEIATLKSNNTELRKHAKELQDGNNLMRSELRAMESRFRTAQDFANTALKSSDDSEAPELEVLRPHAHTAVVQKAHKKVRSKAASEDSEADQDQDGDKDKDDKEESEDKDGDEEEEDDKDGGAASLLSLAARVRRASATREAVTGGSGTEAELQAADAEASSPNDLLTVLSKGVLDLQKEEKESEAKLKAMFLTSFRNGTRRHATLLGQQRALNSTRSSLQALQQKLRAADQRLEATRDGLRQQLRSVGLFTQKLAHVALAPAAEASRLLQAMPQEVTTPPPTSS